jgi:2-methylisocitrate lyase-like PEP mutase family enzyme
MDQLHKAERFQALHNGIGAFVIPNPWDAGSARLLASQGFGALATTSAGLAFSMGYRDGERALSRAAALAGARLVVEATDLPVSADLENGFADTPAEVAETIRLAAAAGVVGGSIEDATGDMGAPIYDFGLAVERIAAAAEAAHALDFPFTLVAGAENFLFGHPDLDDTIRRLRAFERAGADVLFAPGLPTLAAIRAVCAALDKPVAVMMGQRGASFSVAQLAAAGVRRISLGGSLARLALGALMQAAQEIRDSGTFTFASDALPFPVANSAMRGADLRPLRELGATVPPMFPHPGAY